MIASNFQMPACGQSEYIKIKIIVWGSRRKDLPHYCELLCCLYNVMCMILVSLNEKAKLAFHFLHL